MATPYLRKKVGDPLGPLPRKWALMPELDGRPIVLSALGPERPKGEQGAPA
eukprot:CAMPEP_0170404984 /NCGR_PEP_ID=MMETSP0117_2-20130122/26932_1 /TAXON_ID=400756 /ORGANISM="Durinskia baltica, Strain CSIRO CS-38" /LENGTH=50 /DNA_ID=CAMNT_0010662055 /DNA_START=35 /DNA_END=188 /DNA_ORIENTATION=-